MAEKNAIHSRPDFDKPYSMTTQPSEATVQDEKPSSGVLPDSAEATETEDDAPSFGWNDYAERLNGRFAMLGFAALLLTQLFTRQDFWTWIGL